MSEVLARRYGFLLLAYPSEYRERRGDELLGTLLDDASPGQRWPGAREAASIAVEGLRARLDTARRRTPGAMWSEGLQMGALLLLGYAAGTARDGIGLVLALAGIAATLRGRWIVALVPTVAWLAVGVPDHGLSWALGTAVVALGALALGFRTARRVRSAGWLLVAPAVVVMQHGPVLLAVAVVAGFLVVCLIGVALDPRIPIAAACLLVAVTLQNTVGFEPFADAPLVFHPLPASYVLLVMVVALFLAGHVRSRQLARL